MYVEPNFRTKKALKEAVKAGQAVRVFLPDPFPRLIYSRVLVEGPHYPEMHRWYATCEVRNGLVVSVK